MEELIVLSIAAYIYDKKTGFITDFLNSSGVRDSISKMMSRGGSISDIDYSEFDYSAFDNEPEKNTSESVYQFDEGGSNESFDLGGNVGGFDLGGGVGGGSSLPVWIDDLKDAAQEIAQEVIVKPVEVVKEAVAPVVASVVPAVVPVAVSGDLTVTGSGVNRIITYPDGTIKTQGSRSWRNNNSGNLEYGNFAKSHGAIGTDGRFAIFPTKAIGDAAKVALLKGSSYRNLSITSAILRYAPQFENDSAWYSKTIAGAAGVPASTVLNKLTDSQFSAMVNKMTEVEGWKVGKFLTA